MEKQPFQDMLEKNGYTKSEQLSLYQIAQRTTEPELRKTFFMIVSTNPDRAREMIQEFLLVRNVLHDPTAHRVADALSHRASTLLNARFSSNA